MAIPQEFLREGKIRGIVSIRNLKTDEIYLYASEDAVQSYGKERFKLDLGMHPQRQLQNAYTELGLELFIFQLDKEAGETSPGKTKLLEGKGLSPLLTAHLSIFPFPCLQQSAPLGPRLQP